MGVRTNDVPEDAGAATPAGRDGAAPVAGPADALADGSAGHDAPVERQGGRDADAGAAAPGGPRSAAGEPGGPAGDGAADDARQEAGPGGAGEKKPSRRPPAVTRDTARPEGGGRAAPKDAPAPARQWPLLTVLGMTAAGILVVGTDAFAEAFRIGAILIGVALITGAVLRRCLPSVGMLAVRSRFTDMITYGVLGVAIVLLALVTQPKPWLDIPILEDAVHFTVR
ncbi:DUF3017 domain-containing protein [Streptomyces sp. PKU-EA00015]|uniref:DUF3017 domain-containing protein n=1 Tax=Streptomyces sp. PKU-EA00015 TaxID=2748326 RepID=UPI0015A0E56E|nr:DUF3017 domain-containing protein [Streptomyces sp. PKU-EA00015]NWF30921.1 DUF3017 domain-containing protein [Streptomyces sp. PKU-EA00015]